MTVKIINFSRKGFGHKVKKYNKDDNFISRLRIMKIIIIIIKIITIKKNKNKNEKENNKEENIEENDEENGEEKDMIIEIPETYLKLSIRKNKINVLKAIL